MQAVILAAGLGIRLQPVTRDRSKAMAPTLGRPLVERAMMPYAANGITDFVLVVGADDEEIKRHFTYRSGIEVRIRFAVQEERLGMAHALAAAAEFIEGPFVLSACDSLVSGEHVGEVLRAADSADAVLSLLDVESGLVARSASVELDGIWVRRIVEKPVPGEATSNTVSLPHYVFPRRLIDHLAGVGRSVRGEYEIQDAIQALINDGGTVVGIRAAERCQVSTPEDLLALTMQLLREEVEPTHIATESAITVRSVPTSISSPDRRSETVLWSGSPWSCATHGCATARGWWRRSCPSQISTASFEARSRREPELLVKRQR